MELHLFIFLATKSGPAFFQPFSHPSPSHGVPQTCPVGGLSEREPLCSATDAEAPRLKWAEHKRMEHESLFPHTDGTAHFHDLDTKGDFGPEWRLGGCAPSFITVSHIREFNLCDLWWMAGGQQEMKRNQRKHGRRRKWSYWFPL